MPLASSFHLVGLSMFVLNQTWSPRSYGGNSPRLTAISGSSGPLPIATFPSPCSAISIRTQPVAGSASAVPVHSYSRRPPSNTAPSNASAFGERRSIRAGNRLNRAPRTSGCSAGVIALACSPSCDASV
ncbi:hypothetical protein [Cohnella rhizosphaerae]|uniref:Uncharacterized protein n=1 Tax=Cohnella rhizosphaerae TaxID=1457232 RepID=A0A9X4L0J5_9BACL|nr:hypothetical protein [Cohnella rhizosphaerae]MDG0814352.1 hypothetical protein [Cohnella rhizosphaerae]